MSACPMLWLRKDTYCISHNTLTKTRHVAPPKDKRAGKYSFLWTQEEEENQISGSFGDLYFQDFPKDFIS